MATGEIPERQAYPVLSSASINGSGLKLLLFGPMRVLIDGGEMAAPRTRKSLWLLAYLALRGGAGVSREWIATQLWPDSEAGDASRSLRQCLYHLRQALGPHGYRVESPDTKSLRFDCQDVDVDVQNFVRMARSEGEEALRQAIFLYVGPLLDGVTEPWVVDERTRLECMLLDAIESLAAQAAARGGLGSALDALRQGTRLDPFNENLQRLLIQAHSDLNDSAAAVFAYRKFSALLQRELGVAPTPETTDLYLRIREGVSPTIQVSRRPPLGSKPKNGKSKLKVKVPLPLTHLIGRESERQSIGSALANSRLVSLIGPGGVGKTRLALQVAADLAPDFLDGSHFVDLSALMDPSGIAELVLLSFGFTYELGNGSAADTMIRRLGPANLLLVLDNCEHLVESCRPLVARLLGECPHLCVLATSREALRTSGEASLRVSGLRTPTGDDPVDMSTWREFSSLLLFDERARMVDASFSVSETNLLAVRDICQSLDGLPLAIELAAARISSVDIHEIAHRIGTSRGLLSAAGNPNHRHESLEAAFEWSWALLGDDDRRLLSRLTVFAGGWTLEAAEDVCGSQSGARGGVLERLSALVSKSLVEYVRPVEGQGGRLPARYRFLQTVHQFLSERLSDDDVREARAAHLRHFVSWIESVNPKLWHSDQAYWFNRIECDLDNLRSALQLARARGEVESELRIVAAMARYWDTRGSRSEGRENLEVAVSKLGPEVGDELCGAILTHAGWMAFKQRDWSAAQTHFHRAIDLFEAMDNPLQAARVLGYAAAAAAGQADNKQALSLFERSIATLRNAESPSLTAALNNMAHHMVQMGEYSRAEPLLQECIALCDDRPALAELRAIALCNRCYVAVILGSENALSWGREALRVFEAIGAHLQIPSTLDLLAFAETRLDQWDRAAQLLGASRRLADKFEAPRLVEFPGFVESTQELCESKLGPERFEAAYAEGLTMSLDRAVHFAVETVALR